MEIHSEQTEASISKQLPLLTEQQDYHHPSARTAQVMVNKVFLSS
jgi:hypothetical protein